MRATEYKLELNEDGVGVLVKEKSRNFSEFTQLNNAAKIASFMRCAFDLHKKAEEYVYLIALNVRCKPIGLFEISHGSDNATMASPKNIFQRTLLCGSKYIILVHNHPSGCVEPSPQDISNAQTLRDCGKMLDIKFLDSIIVGTEDYCSLQERNLF